MIQWTDAGKYMVWGIVFTSVMFRVIPESHTINIKDSGYKCTEQIGEIISNQELKVRALRLSYLYKRPYEEIERILIKDLESKLQSIK